MNTPNKQGAESAIDIQRLQRVDSTPAPEAENGSDVVDEPCDCPACVPCGTCWD